MYDQRRTFAKFVLCSTLLGLTHDVLAHSLRKGVLYMYDQRRTFAMFVDVDTVHFIKSKYPARGIDYIVSKYPMSAPNSLQGIFYITQYYRRNPNNKFEKKSHLHQRNGQGAYATHAAAFKDIINHRMELEGDFDEVSPGRWAQKESTPTKRARKGMLFLVSVIVIAASSFN